MDLNELCERFRRGRKSRNLSCNEMAKRISAMTGRNLTRAGLANIELGRSQHPRLPIEKAMRQIVQEWESSSFGRAAESIAGYGREQYVCGRCRACVPGPAQDAAYCMSCGDRFPRPPCSCCGREISVGFSWCPFCGQKIDSGGGK